MAVGTLQAIAPYPAQPPAYGLIVAADVIDADEVPARGIEQRTPREWFQGVTWSPEQFHGGGVINVDCHGSSPDGKDSTFNPEANTAEPFAVYAVDECGTFGFEGRDPEGRARRQLLATQSFHIAREFQLGTLRTAANPDLENVALIDATELVGPAASPVEALAMLEAAIADRFEGARAMIHVTPQILTLLMAQRVLISAGQKWLTGLGSIVVADAGYQAVSGVEWMYATALVRIRLGSIEILGENRAQRTDRSINLTTTIAERLVLVQVDATDQAPADSMFKIAVNGVTPWAVAS